MYDDNKRTEKTLKNLKQIIAIIISILLPVFSGIMGYARLQAEEHALEVRLNDINTVTETKIRNLRLDLRYEIKHRDEMYEMFLLNNKKCQKD